jgi:hypothetical protein
VAAPAAPALPATPAPETLGWVRTRQVLRTIDRLEVGSAATAFAAMGIEASLPDPDRPFVIALAAPGGAEGGGDASRVPALAYAPIAPDSTLATLMTGFSPGGVAPLAGGTAFPLLGASTVDGPNRALVEALAGAPLTTDAEIAVSAPTLLRAFGDTVRGALRDVPGLLLASTGRRNALTPEASSALGAALVAWVDAQHSILLTAAVDETTLAATLVSRAPGVSSGPAEGTTLPPYARFVPPGALRAEFRWDAAREAQAPGVPERLVDAVFADQPAARSALLADLRTFTRASAGGALSFGPGGPALVRGVLVLQSDAAPQMYTAVLDLLRRIGEPAITLALWRRMIGLTVQITEGARESEGWPVTRVALSVRPGPGFGGGEKVLPFSRLFARPMAIELVRAGDTLVATLDEAPDVLDGTLAALVAGEGRHPELAARAAAPEGGDLYVDLDLAAGIADLSERLPAARLRRLPALPADVGPVTFFGVGGIPDESPRQLRLSLPRALYTALRGAARSLDTGLRTPSPPGPRASPRAGPT